MCKGPNQVTKHYQTKNAMMIASGVRKWEQSSIFKRETAQIVN